MEKILLWDEGEYDASRFWGFVPSVHTYIHKECREKRPCILVVPGGGYSTVSPTEAGIVAEAYFEKGFQVFVLTYTTDMLMKEALKLQPLKDISRAVRYIRCHADDFHIDANHLAVCGFSAGSHLCESLCVHYKDIEDKRYESYSNKPNAAILSYPLVTAREGEQYDCFRILLGKNIYKELTAEFTGIPGAGTGAEALEYMRIEKQITEDMVPCFIWQTRDDEVVHIENSMLLVQALQTHQIPYAYHIFSHGQHGLSLANERWASGDFGDPYTLDQPMRVVQAVKDGTYVLTEEEKVGYGYFMEFLEGNPEMEPPKENKECTAWLDMSVDWLNTIEGIEK